MHEVVLFSKYVISKSDPVVVGNKQHKIIDEDGCVNGYVG